MQVEVDQSGRVDQTNKPTVLALANGTRFSILISARDKRAILAALKRIRPQWSEALINVSVFSILLYFLLKDYLSRNGVAIVDLEFLGHEPDIKEQVMRLCRRQGFELHKDQIDFRQVGKSSPAHKLAWRVYNKLLQPDRRLSANDVLARFGNKK